MRYALRYRATYHYRNSVPFAQHVVRVLPIDADGQRVETASLVFDPAPVERYDSTDFYGNRISWIAFDRPHQSFEMRLLARVEVRRSELAGPSPAWEAIRDAALLHNGLAARSPLHFLFESPRIGLHEELRRYALPSFTAERPIVDAARDLAARIHDDFRYLPGATEPQTSALEAFRLRQGVCQDFSHVMIGAMRSIGLPAGYVSGFIRTESPAGQPRLEGADAMHAWANVWAGDALGWIGIDPTNRMQATNDHLLVAVGRDYTDVSPVDGIIIASGGQRLDVGADVIALSG
ncbi:MAG TPA: transglutaminase family protein [Burkholderiaceae bacterium]|nr:transglutaminase family protein [Burkholderiaceae bacterium]